MVVVVYTFFRIDGQDEVFVRGGICCDTMEIDGTASTIANR